MNRRPALCRALSLLLLFTLSWPAQLIGQSETLLSVDGSNTEALGFSVSTGMDVNADGIPDFVAGAPEFDGTSLTNNGRVRIIDGSDGSIVHSVEGSTSGDQCGFSVAWVGDVGGGNPIDTQDGVPDYIMGCPGGDYAEVRSGANGALIEDHVGQTGSDFGYSVAGGKDVLGDTFTGGQYASDGVPDYAIGDPSYVSGSDKIGIVYFISGATNDFVFSKPGEYIASGGELAFGTSVEFLEDLDDDGDSEYAVTSGIAGSYGYIFQGGTGTIYRSVCPAGPTCAECNNCSTATFRFAALDDVDGDGTPDYVASTSEASIPSNDSGRVVVYSGDTNPPEELVSFEGTAEDDDFMYIARTGDVDHDGADDVLAGSSAGYYRVHSSKTGTILNQFLETESGNTCCTTINGAGDVNEDGAPDIVIGDAALNSGSGKVKVIAGIDMAVLPDQDLYALAGVNGGAGTLKILLIDPDAPNVTEVLTLDPSALTGKTITGFEHDGTDFYLATWDDQNDESHIYAIDDSTGTFTLIDETNVGYVRHLSKDPISNLMYATFDADVGGTTVDSVGPIDLSDAQVDTNKIVPLGESFWTQRGVAFDAFGNFVATASLGLVAFTYNIDLDDGTRSPVCPYTGSPSTLPCRRWSTAHYSPSTHLAINPNTNEGFYIYASSNDMNLNSFQTIGLTVQICERASFDNWIPFGLTYVPNIQTDTPKIPEDQIAAWMSVIFPDPTPTPSP